MKSTNNLTPGRWMESFGNGVRTSAFSTPASLQANDVEPFTEHIYALDASQAHFAIDASIVAKQLSLDDWMESFGNGVRLPSAYRQSTAIPHVLDIPLRDQEYVEA